MRWEGIINAYYSSHVLFVDIKYAGSYQSEFIAMCNALHGNPKERIVGKSYSVGYAFSDAMRAQGYKTWGYYYDTDYTPTNNIATNQSHYDILGMDYGTSQTVWTNVLSYGKPVMAHILPNSASLTTAQTKAAASGNPGNF